MARFIVFIASASIAAGIYLWMLPEDPIQPSEDSHRHTHQHAHQHAADEQHEEVIEWSTKKSEAADIHISTAQGGAISTHMQAPGRVLIHPDRLAYLTPAVSGVVKEIKKGQGDEVHKGETLAVLESKEVAEAKAAYLVAAKKLIVKETLLQSEEGLQEISPRQDYLQAQAAVEESLIEVELATQKLYALGFSSEEVEGPLQEEPEKMRLYEIRAPFKGTITARNITLGELINETTKAYTMANFDAVWVEIAIPPSGFSYVRPGQEITLSDTQGKKQKAVIDHFTPSVDEQTRTFTAVAIVDNRSGNWAPGKFLRVDIQGEAVQVPIVVPKEAVQKMQGENYVFVAHGADFLPRVVKIGRTDDTSVEIISGLHQGERYADGNTFLLKAEFQKSEAEHSH